MAILIGNEVKQLASGVVIDSAAAAPYEVYTAPATKKVIVTAIVLRCTAASGITVGASAKVEINPAAGDIFTEEVLVDVLAVDDSWAFIAEARSLVVPAGARVDVTITNAATGGTQTLSADVLGYFVF
jgi:hypothetical protein